MLSGNISSNPGWQLSPKLKRELFAAMAMQGTISRNVHGQFPRDIADEAVIYADALIAALAATED